MARSQFGGALIKYLLLILFVGLFVAFIMWKNDLGTGKVKPLPGTTADHIVFLSQDTKNQTNLYLVNSDGTDLRPLTDDATPKGSPAWSPDGKQICYIQEAKENGSTTNQLYLLGGDNKPKPLTYGSTAKSSPLWRSDGKLIGFLVGGVIKVVQPNGNGLDQIYPPPHKGVSTDSGNAEDVSDSFKVPPVNKFQWGPNGVSVAAIQLTEGESAQTAAQGVGSWWRQGKASGSGTQQRTAEPESVIVLSALDRKPFGLLDSDASIIGISWFPDANHVAVSMQTERGAHFIRSYQTSEKDVAPEHILVAAGKTIAPQNLAVSPDGSKIAFEVWRTSSASSAELLGIAVIPAGTGVPLIVRSQADIAKVPIVIKGNVNKPQWSPDGTRLMYSQTNKNGMRDIWVVNANGANAKNITNGHGDCFDASWSPAVK